jgi:putative flippase GtrA
MAQATRAGLAQSPGVQQFVKFCIIGFSSMIIDVSIAKYLTYQIHWYWIWAQTLSFAVAVTNGYTWNSLWTFKGATGKKHEQYMKFVAVNVVGLLLNISIMKLMFLLFTGHLFHQGNPEPMQWNIAKGVAIVIVSAWNFFANKKWTFKTPVSTV